MFKKKTTTYNSSLNVLDTRNTNQKEPKGLESILQTPANAFPVRKFMIITK